MKKTYRYIRFNQGESGIWWCNSKKGDDLLDRGDDLLGSVSIFEQWKQYCFFPAAITVFSSECLDDIADFLRQLNKGNVSNTK